MSCVQNYWLQFAKFFSKLTAAAFGKKYTVPKPRCLKNCQNSIYLLMLPDFPKQILQIFFISQQAKKCLIYQNVDLKVFLPGLDFHEVH